MMDILLYTLLLITLGLWFYIVIGFLLRKSLQVRERLDSIEQIAEKGQGGLDTSILTGKTVQTKENLRIPLIGRYLQNIEKRITRAHVMMKPLEFVIISLGAALFFFVLAYILTGQLLLASAIGISGYFLPTLFLARTCSKRAKKLSDQLPEFITILSNSLRAGLGLNQAINSASGEMEDPIRWEFHKLIRDNSLGKPMEEAFNDLVKRTNDKDIELLSNAVIIQRQIGGNLSEILDLIAKTIRDRITLKGEVKALTAQSRMSAAIISLLPIGVALAIATINPGYLDPLITEPLGRILLGGIVFMMLLGMFLLNKISKLEV